MDGPSTKTETTRVVGHHCRLATGTVSARPARDRWRIEPVLGGGPLRPARRGRATIATLVLILVGLAASSAFSATAEAADFTWNGAAPAGSSGWSNPANWVGGVAPSNPVGTLTFPTLVSPACTANPSTAACYTSTNDIAGLSPNAISIDDGSPYVIAGSAITLGGGGVTASTAATCSPTCLGMPLLSLPVALGASQTWSIDGNLGVGGLQLRGNVTGPSAQTLGIDLSNQGSLLVAGSDVEVGPVTISGPGGVVTVGSPRAHASLNTSDGQPVSTASGASLDGFNGTVGPLTVAGAGLFVVDWVGQIPGGTFAVNGPVALTSNPVVRFGIHQAGTTVGTDYSQLSASGAVSIASTPLEVDGPHGGCPALHPGDVYTLITTTGALTGTFVSANGSAPIPDGATISMACNPGTPPQLRINYTAHTVTATVLGPGAQPTLSVLEAGSGAGSVTGSAISCPGTCAASYPPGTTVTLTATPAAGSTFTGWSGAGCGATGTCTVTMSSDQTVTATFASQQPAPVLSVSVSGSGAGSVTGSGISCPGTCSQTYPTGTMVTLTASPASGATFSGWSGAGCSGTATCTVAMSADQAVTATFTPATQHTLSVSLAGTGSGTVSGTGISCPTTCTASYPTGTVVTLTATPAGGSTFGGWSGGGCSGTGTCTVTMSSDQALTASFTPARSTLSVSLPGSGSGTVTGSGISCPGTCSASYPTGTLVTLTATPAGGSTFGGWSGGGCSGTGSCTVTMSADQTVTANFTPVQRTLTVSLAGSGSGTVTAPGISCPGICSASYSNGTVVTLNPSPPVGSTLTGWSGGGSSSGAGCTRTVTMNSDQAVTATFAASTSDFTWSGAAAPDINWSNGSNWVGCGAPSGTVGTVTFPALATSFPRANNDVRGLSVNALTIDTGSLTDASFYQIAGNAITLGAGGLTSGTTRSNPATATLGLPIVLGAAQTWSIDGASSFVGGGLRSGVLVLAGSVTAPAADTLGIAMSSSGELDVTGDIEVGPVTDTGDGSVVLGTVGTGSLNATDGQPVKVTATSLSSINGAVGPLTLTDATLQLGRYPQDTGTLNVNGPVTLDSRTFVNEPINGPHDYSQLRATGNVNLGSARLALFPNQAGACATLPGPADVLALVKTTKLLTGTFDDVFGRPLPDGSDAFGSCAGVDQYYRIQYTGNTVTATLPPPAVSIASPRDQSVFTQFDLTPAVYRCSPGLDGPPLRSCKGTVPYGFPIDTTVGVHSFTVTATDAYGRTATATTTYTVSPPPPLPPGSTCGSASHPYLDFSSYVVNSFIDGPAARACLDPGIEKVLRVVNAGANYLTADLKNIYALYDAVSSGKDALLLGFCALNTVIGDVPGAIACLGAWSLSYAKSQVISTTVEKLDPPDSSYRSILLPRPFRSLVLRTAVCYGATLSQCKSTVAAAVRIARSSARVDAILEAVLLTGNRYGSAQKARDLRAATAQVAARKTYEGLLVPAIRAQQADEDSLLRVAARLKLELRRSASRAVRAPSQPSALRRRLKRDGVDLRSVGTLIKRDIQKARRTRQLTAAAHGAFPAGPFERDYNSMNIIDIGTLVSALRHQKALARGDFIRLEKELASVFLRCTAAGQASQIVQFRHDLLSHIAPRFRSFMRIAVAPLTNPSSAGLRALPPVSGCR